MCGITGFISRESQPVGILLDALTRMSERLTHRGPDAAGEWIADNGQIALAHRRLAIVDLSPTGKQPMESQRYSLVFNGEIYNFRTLRRELEQQGISFNGHSDTEVLLYGFECWGIEETLSRVEGMFAFCAYDKDTKTIYLARDRMGEKPLYFSHNQHAFIFGSELKALTSYPLWNERICHKALGLYFKHNCIPAPYTIYENTYKLEPGHYLTFNVQNFSYDKHCYWSAKDAFISGAQTPFSGTPLEAADEIEKRLKDSIRDQMLADVPLGAFLSGGIDSSSVTAIMQSLSDKPINTFSIGFDFHSYNEAEHAKAIANHLGASHTELYVSESDTTNIIPALPEIYDEPFADSSQIPTYLVCKMAREYVTVALSGDGGDELFAGYSRYHQVQRSRKSLNSLKGQLHKTLIGALTKLPASSIDRLLSPLLSIASKYPKHAGTRLKSNNYVSQQDALVDYYRSSIEFWHKNSNLVLNPENCIYSLNNPELYSLDFSDLHLMQYMDTQMYLPDDILTKVDRAGMAVSLETRIPILNHKIVEFAATLPDQINTHDNKAKWPLQEVLSRYIPRTLFERPKQGFAIPIGEWLRGPLNEWMMDLLNESSIKQQGLLNYDAIKPILEMHMDGNSDYSLNLWSILMFQSWLQHNSSHT